MAVNKVSREYKILGYLDETKNYEFIITVVTNDANKLTEWDFCLINKNIKLFPNNWIGKSRQDIQQMCFEILNKKVDVFCCRDATIF
jgi:hypothetical protein